jgi:fatty-acyl-CoA synthase
MDWKKRTLPEVLAAAAQDAPDQEALVIENARITYAALWDRVRLVAANLKRLGVRPGDHIAICLPNSIDWATLWYAAGTLGAVTVPVNTRFKTEEIRYCLSQSDAKLLVTVDRFLKIDFLQILREVEPALDLGLPGQALPLLHTVVVMGEEVPAGALAGEVLFAPVPASALPDVATEGTQPDDVLLIQYTSGSTAFPKGVMLSHDNMLRDAAGVGGRLGLRRDDRYFYARPFYHVAGTTLALLNSLQFRCTLVAVATFDPAQSLALMEAERCTVTGGNDTIYLMLMNHPDFPNRRFKLRVGWVAGSPSVSQQIIDRFGMEGLCSAYGLSESGPNVWMAYHDDAPDKRVAGLAHPLPGLEVRLIDPETGQPGSQGEIQVRGWSVMKGYYKMPEQTARTLDQDQWLHTGDLGITDGEGRFAFAARLKEVFRVGGENVAPAEVEDVLHRHPAVRQAQVVGVPHERLGEVGAAFVVLNEGSSVTEEELIEWCRARCANFRVPRHVRMIDTFEPIGMTGSGKVQKIKLRTYALTELGLESKA